MKSYEWSGLTWRDVSNFTSSDISALLSDIELPPSLNDDLRVGIVRPTIEAYPSLLYVALPFPMHGKDSDVEVFDLRLIATPQKVVTLHSHDHQAIQSFTKSMEMRALAREKAAFVESLHGQLVFDLLESLYTHIQATLALFSSHIKEIEDDVFAGKEKEMVREISILARSLLFFKRTIADHRNVLAPLTNISGPFFGNIYTDRAERISNLQIGIYNDIKKLQEIVAELRETNDSLITTKQNEVMKILTIMAFVTFPLSLIAGIFGMNTKYLPFVGHPFDFWIISGLMFALTVAFFAYFKKKKWL